MTAPLRVLQVITDTDRRGAQVFALDLAGGLDALGAQVTTVALAPGTRPDPLAVETLGDRQRSPATLRALHRRMRDVDVTVAHGSSTLLACGLAAPGTGRPFVYRQISDSRFWAPDAARRARVRAYLRRADTVVALSEEARRTLHTYLRVPLHRIAVVPNAVPGSGFAPATPAEQAAARVAFGLPADAVVALYVGALVPEKGVADAIEAVAAAPALHLAIAGDGPERALLERTAARCAPGRVHFLGDLAAPAAAYRAADVAVLTSRGGDSMPAVLIEAGLSGLPSVTCPVGAIPEVVIDGLTGLVVPSGDLAAIGHAFVALAHDPELRTSMGRAAEEHCRGRYTIDAVAPHWLAVLVAVSRSRR